ncbi:hypothetical protein [Streptomyces chiangmaiensis]|uniref:Uncharacterized protein n=1 Tax=Streptomyces chiangmaiensis TaxID=766497 RepID=A0ABU7FHK9_9ACTN|nr:hypothetical protein [Streptomyces chiangmaiensis]MED7823414.1 hypothetical protein [Streptomyces chiangmaiensis]
MGVFGRLFRRSRTTEEARSAAVEATRPTTPAGADAPDEAQDATTSAAGSKGAVEVTIRTADQAVGIPKQQSAEKAVDNGADEGARR